MCGHVKKQEVLFLCGEDAFLYQVFCQTFSNIPQLVVKLQGIPGLSWRRIWDQFKDIKHIVYIGQLKNWLHFCFYIIIKLLLIVLLVNIYVLSSVILRIVR